jgi:hypothetical protein
MKRADRQDCQMRTKAYELSAVALDQLPDEIMTAAPAV